MWDQFERKYGSFPSGLPQLYADTAPEALATFLAADKAEAIAEFPRIAVVPFASERGDETEEELGFGLARLLARDLSLLSTHSVLGQEDTPDEALWYRKDVESFMREQDLDACFMGRLGRTEEGLSFRLRLRMRGGQSSTEEIEASDLDSLLTQVTRLGVGMLGTSLRESIRPALEAGRPASFSSLRLYGQLLKACAAYKPESDLADERLGDVKSIFRKLHTSDPSFVLPLLACPAELRNTEGGRRMLKEAFDHDPFDPQLCFYLFLSLWDGSENQPEAAQLLRRAIELSPGHGKSHMCFGHALPSHPNLLKHAELGYKLLPTNTFAIGNYLRALRGSGSASPEELIKLAKQGIDADKHDPTNYEQMVELLKDQQRYKEALGYAVTLQKLLTPPVHERTQYCLRQQGGDLRSTPKDVQKLVKWLRARSED